MSKKRRSRAKKDQPVDAAATGESTMSRSPSLILVGFALVGVAVFTLVLLGTDPPPPPKAPPIVHPVERWQRLPVQEVGYVPERDFAKGPDDAAVTIVTFSDFECPYCQDAKVELDAVHERFPDDVRVVFRNYPLDPSCNANMQQSGHLHACKAAIMARCAGAQDRFWEMHDAIFALPKLSVSALDALPAEIGLDAEAFAVCVTSDEAMQNLQADISDGKRLGVTGTPAVFVNGRKMSTFRAPTLAAIVDYVIARSEASE